MHISCLVCLNITIQVKLLYYPRILRTNSTLNTNKKLQQFIYTSIKNTYCRLSTVQNNRDSDVKKKHYQKLDKYLKVMCVCHGLIMIIQNNFTANP